MPGAGDLWWQQHNAARAILDRGHPHVATHRIKIRLSPPDHARPPKEPPMWMSHPNVIGLVTVIDSAFYGGWNTLGWVVADAPVYPYPPDAGWPVSEGEVPGLVGTALATQLPAAMPAAIAAAGALTTAVANSTFVSMITGLDGTGATNMATLIQAALTAATPGSTVRLPGTNKTYMIASGLTIPSRVTLDLGGAILQVKNAATGVTPVTFSGVTGSRLTNGRLQGNVTNKQTAVGFTAAATDCVVDHCSIDANFQIVICGGDAGVACVN